jgi:hypothetical protein
MGRGHAYGMPKHQGLGKPHLKAKDRDWKGRASLVECFPKALGLAHTLKKKHQRE